LKMSHDLIAVAGLFINQLQCQISQEASLKKASDFHGKHGFSDISTIYLSIPEIRRGRWLPTQT
jgi:hypothetical protein